METDSVTMQCPQCNAADSIEQSEGARLCLSCLYEGPFVPRGDATPASTSEGSAEVSADAPTAVPLPPLIPDTDDPDDDDDDATAWGDVAALTVDGAPAVPYEPPTIEAHHMGAAVLTLPEPNLAGSWVHVRPDREDAVCVTDDGGDYVVVLPNGGDPDTVARIDVRLIDTDGVHLGEHDENVHDFETVLPEVMFAIAAAILTTGADCISDDAERTFSAPGYGWAPPPADQVPEMEIAAAYAVAILIRHYDLDTADVRIMAANLLNLASAATTTEGSDGDDHEGE